MRDVAVVGIGIMKWGELWEKSFRDIFTEAALNAIDDAHVDHIDSLYVGCMTGGLFVGQEHIGAIMADYLGQKNIAAARVESACASGGISFRQAYIEVASGMSDIVMAGGVEKMTDTSGDGATYALATAADQEYEVFHGVTFPGLYAMMARSYMEKYKTTRRQLSAVPYKNHQNGSKNPYAQYPFPIKLEDVEKGVLVADPLHILDCSPITDGAAAVILTTVDIAKKLKKPIIKVIGSGLQRSDQVLSFPFGRQEEHICIGSCRLRSHSPADLHAVQTRHHPIQHREFWRICALQEVPGLIAINGGDYLIAPLGQRRFQNSTEDDIVFCNQDPHSGPSISELRAQAAVDRFRRAGSRPSRTHRP